MSSRYRTHSEFIEEVGKVHPNIKVLTRFEGLNKKITILNEYGKCRVYAGNLLKGNTPSISTALDKNSYLEKVINDKNPGTIPKKYTIVGNFKSYSSRVLVKTPYGLCDIQTQHLVMGKIPTIQCAKDKNSYIVNRFRSVHEEKYDYSEVEYSTMRNKVTIVCPKHGRFRQSPNHHLYGARGCPDCAKLETSRNPWRYSVWKQKGSVSEHFDGYKVYILKCWDEESGEEFYKIGKTFRTVQDRYKSTDDIPYSYEIIFTKTLEDPNVVSCLENDFKNAFKGSQYTPSRKFSGSTSECFSNIDFKKIDKISRLIDV